MDNLEKIFVNSPLRRLMQKYLEFDAFQRFLEKNNINLSAKTILDAGCGSGYGLVLLHQAFKPRELYGFDILPDEVKLARQRKIPAIINVDSIVHTKFPSGKFDAIFEFTVLHHVPEWRQAMVEIQRILQPNGVFLASDLNKQLTDFFEKTTGIRHPKEAQFQWPEFIQGLQNARFDILEKKLILGKFGLFLCQKKDERTSN